MKSLTEKQLLKAVDEAMRVTQTRAELLAENGRLYRLKLVDGFAAMSFFNEWLDFPSGWDDPRYAVIVRRQAWRRRWIVDMPPLPTIPLPGKRK